MKSKGTVVVKLLRPNTIFLLLSKCHLKRYLTLKVQSDKIFELASTTSWNVWPESTISQNIWHSKHHIVICLNFLVAPHMWPSMYNLMKYMTSQVPSRKIFHLPSITSEDIWSTRLNITDNLTIGVQPHKIFDLPCTPSKDVWPSKNYLITYYLPSNTSSYIWPSKYCLIIYLTFQVSLHHIADLPRATLLSY